MVVFAYIVEKFDGVGVVIVSSTFRCLWLRL